MLHKLTALWKRNVEAFLNSSDKHEGMLNIWFQKSKLRCLVLIINMSKIWIYIIKTLFTLFIHTVYP